MGLEAAQGDRVYGSSADGTAVLRSIGAREPDPGLRCPDYLARGLIGDLRVAMMSDRPRSRRLARWLAERRVPGAYWFETARVKHFDALLLAEAAAGVAQVVILGAGLDSRPYRFAAELSAVDVFEVDHPATAARKAERLRAVVPDPPPNVSFVRVDLARDDLAAALAAAGFDAAAPVFVIWCGVTMYLDATAVDDVLAWLAGRPAPSSIAFDYARRDFIDGSDSVHGAAEMRRWLDRIGEPLTFGIDPGELSSYLEKRGLRLASDLGSEEQASRYLRAADGRIGGQPYGFSNLAHARVAGKSARLQGES